MLEYSTCVICGKGFVKHTYNQQCCSKKCALVAHKLRNAECYKKRYCKEHPEVADRINSGRTCIICGKPIIHARPGVTCGAKECVEAQHRERVYKNTYGEFPMPNRPRNYAACKICGKPITDLRRSITCSAECAEKLKAAKNKQEESK